MPRRNARRLQLTLTPATRRLMDQVKGAIEAESYGELVRRALILAEARSIVGRFEELATCTERLQITLPERSIARLESLKARLGPSGSYAEVIKRFVVMLAAELREMAAR